MEARTIGMATVRRAIAKALEVKPTVLQVDANYWAVASSAPGKAWLVERDPESGDLWCPCPGNEYVGLCYHRAALGLLLGTIPEGWLPTPVPAPADVYTYEPVEAVH